MSTEVSRTANIGKETLKKMYRKLPETRRFEEKVWDPSMLRQQGSCNALNRCWKRKYLKPNKRGSRTHLLSVVT